MAKSSATGMCQIMWIVCGWLISPHRTLCTLQIILPTELYAVLLLWVGIYSSAGMSRIIWFVVVKPFFLFQKNVFGCWHFAVSIAYCVHYLLSRMFSYEVFWKLDLFLMSDSRNGSFPFSPYRILHFLNQTISKMLCLKNVKMIRSVQK